MEPLSVVRRSRWTLLDQGVLETQEEEAGDAASTGVEAEVALREEKAGEGVVMAVIVAEGTEERAAMAVVVAVASAEIVEVEDAASTGAEAGVAWMEVAVVVAAAMVAASLEDTREVGVVAVEGEDSRMPMVSRSKPTKSVSPLRLVVVGHLF